MDFYERTQPDQSGELEDLFDQLVRAQRCLQRFSGIPPVLLCVLHPDAGTASQGTLRIAFLSPDWQRVMVWDGQAMMQQDWFAWVHPDDLSASRVQLQSLLRRLPDLPAGKSQPCCQFQNRMRHTNDSHRALSWQFNSGEDGLLYGTAVLLQTSDLPPDRLQDLTQDAAIAPFKPQADPLQQMFQQANQTNATLEAKMQQRMVELRQAFEFEATLKRITDKVRDSLDESHILQTAVQELTLALGISSCDTGIYSREQNSSTIAYEYIQGDVPIAQGKTIPIEAFPEYYQPLLQGHYLQFCWHNAVYVTGTPVRAVQKQFAVLACPIIDDRGVLGDLWLYKNSDAIYEEPEIRLVQQVANQCAIAIRQARLYRATQMQVVELERLNYLKDDFLNTISHELRTPVANIQLAAEMLEIHLQQMHLLGGGTPLDRYFEILKQETQREIDLINDLLDLSRLDADTEPLLLTTIDLRMWIPHVVEPFVDRARSQQQALELHIPDSSEGETLPLLTTDLDNLERIITELLDNACKYTPPRETIALSVCPTPNQTALQLSVSNSGIEIPPHEQTRIFDKFYRIPNSDPWKYSGVGLGLALVKKRVERLGGTIEVQSSDYLLGEATARRSTCFVLTLPLGQPEAQEPSIPFPKPIA